VLKKNINIDALDNFFFNTEAQVTEFHRENYFNEAISITNRYTHISFQHSFIGVIDVFDIDHFHIGNNIVVAQKSSISCVSLIPPISEPMMLLLFMIKGKACTPVKGWGNAYNDHGSIGS
jgi:hypothetical protein